MDRLDAVQQLQEAHTYGAANDGSEVDASMIDASESVNVSQPGDKPEPFETEQESLIDRNVDAVQNDVNHEPGSKDGGVPMEDERELRVGYVDKV